MVTGIITRYYDSINFYFFYNDEIDRPLPSANYIVKNIKFMESSEDIYRYISLPLQSHMAVSYAVKMCTYISRYRLGGMNQE